MTAIAWAGCLGEASLIGALVILLRLSAKLGEVTKMKPYYRATMSPSFSWASHC